MLYVCLKILKKKSIVELLFYTTINIFYLLFPSLGRYHKYFFFRFFLLFNTIWSFSFNMFNSYFKIFLIIISHWSVSFIFNIINYISSFIWDVKIKFIKLLITYTLKLLVREYFHVLISTFHINQTKFIPNTRRCLPKTLHLDYSYIDLSWYLTSYKKHCTMVIAVIRTAWSVKQTSFICTGFTPSGCSSWYSSCVTS